VRRWTAIVRLTGVPLHVAETAGLVHVIVVFPVEPDAEKLPLHGVRATVCELNVKLPANRVDVVVPDTLPVKFSALYVPLTSLPDCVRFIENVSTPLAPP